MKKTLISLVFPFVLVGTSCTRSVKHSEIANQLISILDHDPELKKLVTKSINKAAVNNPDHVTNPVRNLNQLYDFIDYSITCMPWNITKGKYDDFATKCDQSILYVYYLLDQPLDELKNMNLFYNSVEYLTPLVEWFVNYNNTWRNFLDSEASWKDEYYQMLRQYPEWRLDEYEDPSNWHTFNEFFSRRLKNPRKIGTHDVVSPADSLPQGVWEIKNDGTYLADSINDEHGIPIKSSCYVSVKDMLGPEGEKYAEYFRGGRLTHTYLNYDDYHRFHFPVNGKIVSCYKIPFANAVGGIVYWDKEYQRYFLESDSPSWQAVETRGVIIIDTDGPENEGYTNCGLVAVIPVGMGQVSSVNWDHEFSVGEEVKKGHNLGYFLFGGSDCVMMFEKQANFEITVPKIEKEEGYYGGYKHVLCSEDYGVFLGKE